MTREVLEAKLVSLERCVARIRHATLPSADALRDDLDAQDVLALNIVRAVQICVDIASHVLSEEGIETPASMGEAIDGLHRAGWIDSETSGRIRKAVAFRNIAVHAYQSVNVDILHAVGKEHVHDVEEFMRQVLRKVNERPG